jgi:CubicO group peptidase (beta-lactamase class C family)
MPNPKSSVTPDQFMQRLGALPLMAQPGEQWLYTAGSNVLGVLVARAAGKPLDAVLSERILAPLGMKDTAFHIPPEKLGRFITGYMPQDGKLTLFDPPDGMYVGTPAFPAGDSGLISTADDFGTFARFYMMTGLAPDGRRLLTEASLKAIALSIAIRSTPIPYLMERSTWLGARRDFYPLISDNRHDLTGGVSQRDRVVHVDRVLKTSQTRDPICEPVRNRT